jgi:hypothetical protein
MSKPEGLEPGSLEPGGPVDLKSCGVWQMNPTFLCSSKELRLGINGANKILMLNRT